MFRRSIKKQQKLRALLELVAAIQIDRNESTTNYADLQEQSRQLRDMILDMQGAFLRLLEPAMGRVDSSGSGFLQSSGVGNQTAPGKRLAGIGK